MSVQIKIFKVKIYDETFYVGALNENDLKVKIKELERIKKCEDGETKYELYLGRCLL